MSIDNYDNILKKALQEVDKKKLNEAKDLFIKLTELDNKRYEGFLNLSNILVIENKQKEANNILQDYLKKRESHPEIVKGIAINLFNSNKIIELNSHLEKYIYKIEDHLLYYLKGYCLNIEGITSDSENFLKKSINLNKNFWLSYELLINIYNQKSKIIEMNKLIKLAKKLFPKKIRLSYFEALYLSSWRLSN